MRVAGRMVAEKRLPLAAVAVLVLSAALVHVGGRYPQRARLQAAEMRAAEAARAVVVRQAELEAVQRQLAGKRQADVELEQFYGRILPQDLAGARSITYPRLAALADEMGLALERRTSERGREEESELGRLRTTLLLAGEYGGIRRFIEALETAPEFLVIDEIVLTQREDDDDASLALTIGISTYYRATPEASRG